MGSLLTNVLSASAFALLTTSAAVLEERFFDPVCVQISNAISSASDVYYFGHLKYAQGIEHWASSSTQTSKCVVEPGSAADVGIIGIVTRFTLKTFPQTQVWGGVITYSALRLDDVSAAVNAFSASVTDPKAAIITNYNFVLGQPGIAHIMFYDGPSPPSGIFDDFMDIPHVTQDVSTRSFLSLIQSVPAGATSGTRGTFQTVPLQEITPSILDAVVNETKFWGPRLGLLESAFFLSYAIEPFLPSILSHNPSGQLSAYPPSRSMAFLPANVYFSWLLPLSDDGMIQAIKLSAQRLTNLAIAEGQSLLPNAPKYPNYAITGTPLSEMYGANVPTLQTLKASIDPTNVMGLAGGWKF
ncbi:hypothetical protein ONZ45_g12439 [Pleurotus djamor]|nr:hypothetical protein ONZ45_g12439 [Pleurotus djamor]